MSNTPHELHDDFPGKAQRIHDLKISDPHFAKLAADYHEVNRAVHRAETRVDFLSEEQEEHLRKTRSHLKDQIARLLA